MHRFTPLASTTETATPELSRRAFLQSVAVSGGLLIGCGLLPASLGATPSSSVAAAGDAELRFNAFVKISPDSTVTVVVKHLDMGQGVSTGLTSLVAEELDASWEQMRWEFAPADASRYNNLFWGQAQGTGGSSSIANSYAQLRHAGAAARAMLLEAAAHRWKVAPENLTISGGVISYGNNTLRFGDVVAEAARLTPPQTPKLKDPKDFSLIGKPIGRQDSQDKSSGQARYTQDMYLPGMLTALVAYPPKVFGKVKHFSGEKAKAVPGVVAVVPIPRGVAVVAENFWAAKKGRELLQIDWDLSACETRSSDELFRAFHAAAAKPGQEVRAQGDVSAALGRAEKVIEVQYELPYLAHAAIEPLNCVAQVGETGAEFWYACQMPTVDQTQIAALLKCQPEQVRINTLYAGGSFGRRACADDYVVDATHIAKQFIGRPVKMMWLREDEILNARYRPMAVHHIRAALASDGLPLAWQHHVAAQPVLRGTPFAAFIHGPVDGTITEGVADMAYAIPHLQISGTEMTVAISTLWWRSVGHSGNAFVVETFIDRLAKTAGQDPLAYRRKLLAKEPRALAVLNLVAEKSAWATPLAEDRYRGVALHRSFGTWVAQVAEVRLNADGSFQVEKVHCAVDCGVAINPDVIRAQMEGGLGMGLSAALGEVITLAKGQVTQTNYHNYPLMSIAGMPDVEVSIVPSAEPPSGVGEPGLPPIAPAVANALYAATGVASTRLPLGTTPKAV